MAIGQRRVRQWPEVLSGLQLGGVGWQEEQMHMLRHTQPRTRMPARPIQHEDDLLVGACADCGRERLQFDLEETQAHGRGEVEDRALGRRMDETDQIAPLKAVLDGSVST